MARTVAVAIFLSFVLGLAFAQTSAPEYLHISTYAASACSGPVQVYDTYISGTCTQTNPTQSVSFSCNQGNPVGLTFSNTSDCSVSGDNTNQVDLSTCNSVYIMESTSTCDSSVLTNALGPNYVVRYSWGETRANCLDDPSLTVQSPSVVTPVGLVAANQMALDTCSDYNGLQWNARSVFPTVFPNNTMQILLFSAPGCNQADFIGLLDPEHGVCGTVVGSSATFYETWFSSVAVGNNAPSDGMPPMSDFPPMDFPPMDFPPMDFPPMEMPPMNNPPPMDMPPMNNPPMNMPPMSSPPTQAPTASGPVASAPTAAPVAAAPVAAPSGPIAPPVMVTPAAKGPMSGSTQSQVALVIVVVGCLLSLLF